MKQLAFERERRAAWQDFARDLEALERRDGASHAPTDAGCFVEAFRHVARDLAVARSRNYSAVLVDELNGLVSRGHNLLYAHRGGALARVAGFVTAEFPQRVRRDAGYVWMSAAAFVVPMILVALAVADAPDVLYSVLSEESVRSMEAAYRPDAEAVGRTRAAESDFAMFGYYIFNNVSIGFQAFATGIAFGLGTLFYLGYNGVVIGALGSHLVTVGYGGTFFPFVVGHGAFELTAIVLSGAAGLKLGHALLAPGQWTRAVALRGAASEAVTLVLGASAFLVIAAFVEAYWSSTGWPAPVKYAVGLVLWGAVIGYLTLAGRSRAA